MIARFTHGLRRLRDDQGGLAFVEFAFILPVFLLMSLTGVELTNYIITRMRVSQLALHLADNAARIGSGSLLQAKIITESDINDLLTGAELQASELDIYGRGRVIISSLEPMANPNTDNKFKIAWQRCRGSKTGYASSYGVAGQASGTNMTGMGPAGRQVTAIEGNATIFVEIQYDYSPIFKTSIAPTAKLSEIASMAVRDRRDLSNIDNSENAAVSSC